MQLGADGSIVLLRFPGAEDLASVSSPMASFSYQTFNDSEWQPFTYAYLNDHQMQRGFCKPGSNNFTESAIWRPQLEKLYVNGSSRAANFILAQMRLPEKPRQRYGAPSKIYLKIMATSSTADLTFTTIGKQPTMIGESSSISFLPAAPLRALHGSAWRLMKLDQEIDPEGVLDGGNQFTHGVWGGVSARTAHGVFKLDSLDAINVNPIIPEFPVGNPLPASYQESVARAGKGLSRLAPGSIKGMAVNLHNNLWNTNYALFYPYYDARRNTYCASFEGYVSHEVPTVSNSHWGVAGTFQSIMYDVICRVIWNLVFSFRWLDGVSYWLNAWFVNPWHEPTVLTVLRLDFGNAQDSGCTVLWEPAQVQEQQLALSVPFGIWTKRNPHLNMVQHMPGEDGLRGLFLENA